MCPEQCGIGTSGSFPCAKPRGYALSPQLPRPATGMIRCCSGFVICFAVRTIAAWPMQSLARPAGQSKGCFSEFSLRARCAPRARKFLRYRFALLTFPPVMTRRRICTGCDHAVHQRKEKYHEQHQTFTSSLCREPAEIRHRPEGILARDRSCLASQVRQGLRHRDPRRHQRQWTDRLHRAEEGRYVRVDDSRPLALRLRRAILRIQAGHSSGCPAFCLPAAQPGRGYAGSHFACGIPRKVVEARLILRFSRRMSRLSKLESKLCASRTRHAMRFSALAENASLQLAKEGAALRLILPWLPPARQCGAPWRFHASEQESA